MNKNLLHALVQGALFVVYMLVMLAIWATADQTVASNLGLTAFFTMLYFVFVGFGIAAVEDAKRVKYCRYCS